VTCAMDCNKGKLRRCVGTEIKVCHKPASSSGRSVHDSIWTRPPALKLKSSTVPAVEQMESSPEKDHHVKIVFSCDSSRQLLIEIRRWCIHVVRIFDSTPLPWSSDTGIHIMPCELQYQSPSSAARHKAGNRWLHCPDLRASYS
jgi:hypothetical protein